MKKRTMVVSGLAVLLALFVTASTQAQMMPGMMSASGGGIAATGMGASPGMMAGGMMGMGDMGASGGMPGGMMSMMPMMMKMMPMMMNMMGGMGAGSMSMGALQTPETQALMLEARGEWLLRQGEITKKMGEELIRQAGKLKEAGKAPEKTK